MSERTWVDFMGTRRAAFHEPDRPGSHLLWAAADRAAAPVQGPIHLHPGFELGVVLEGREEITYRDSVAVCRPGDVWLCSSSEPHQMRVPLSGTRVDVFVFGREFLGEDPLGRGMPWITPFIADPSERPRADSPEARKRLLVRAQILWQEVTAKRPDWQSMVRHDLLCLLTDLVREWAPTEGIDVAVGASAARLARVLPALNLVHARLSERVTVRDAASACGLSASRFQVVFRRIVGSSFGEYGLRARVLHAAQLLLHTDRTLSAIAREAGFIDDSHMRRRFVAHYGCTPAEYRRVRLLHARMHAREL